MKYVVFLFCWFIASTCFGQCPSCWLPRVEVTPMFAPVIVHHAAPIVIQPKVVRSVLVRRIQPVQPVIRYYRTVPTVRYYLTPISVSSCVGGT